MPTNSQSATIHPTAIIHPAAQLHSTVEVGPYTIIGEGVKIGEKTKIGPHVIIEGITEIGANNQIFAGAVIGSIPQDLKYQGERSLVQIGDHNVIREYVTINRATGENEATIVGNNNLIMAYVHLAHNCILADEIIMSNNVTLAGHVIIESQAIISGVLGVHQFVHIGSMAMVGGMSRINRDVPPFMLVEGNPAKVRSLNLVGLKRRGFSSEDMKILKQAFRILYRSEISFTEAIEKLYSLPENEYLNRLQKFLKLSVSSDRRGPLPGK
ncbi:MAG: acyl-ACP--UDP-N-acetylglucosamine O-acyltransferase [Prochloraceae cyanobacterium]